MIDQVTRTFDSMTVDKAYFKSNLEYKVTCKAMNTAQTAYGYVSKTLNTLEFDDKIGIGMSPASGAPYSTVFSIFSIKPITEALNCVFGYKNSFGEVLIEDLSRTGQRFSSQNQALQTKLPSPEDGSNLLPVFVRCTDSLGRHKTAHVTITIKGDDNIN